MREPLMVAVAQPLCLAHDVAANARAHAAAIRGAAGARVVVFPELSLTGYELDADPVDPGDEWLQPIVAACADTGAVALAGAPRAACSNRRPQLIKSGGGDGSAGVHRRAGHRRERCHGGLPEDVAGGGGSQAVHSRPRAREADRRRLAAGAGGLPGDRRGPAPADTAALGIDAYLAGTVMAADEAEMQNERGRRISTGHHLWVALASFAGPTGGGYDQTAGQSGIWAPDGTW